MAIETLAGIPAELTAGDSLQWTTTLADYSASDSWSVSTYFRADDGRRFEVVMSGVTTTWTGTLDGSDTSKWSAGVYSWHTVVSKNADRITVDHGQIRVLPDPEGETPPSHARRMLDAIEALIEGRLTSDKAERFTINGQSIDKMPSNEIREWRNYYAAEVAAERNRDRQFRGGRSHRIVRTRFVS